MPLFEHKCGACGHQFEVLVRPSQVDQSQPCQRCEHPDTQRLITPASFSLKGGGWYKDGYTKEK